jgi:hypothetical protein
MKFRMFGFGFLLVLAVISGVYASSPTGDSNAFPQTRVTSADDKDIQTVGFRTALAGTDTLTTAGILATTEFRLLGKTIVKVGVRFSNSAATCKVRLAYVYKTDLKASASSTNTGINKIIGLSDERLITAGTVQYEAAYYPTVNGDEYFDGGGAIAIRVIVTQAPSAGTVDLWVGSK